MMILLLLLGLVFPFGQPPKVDSEEEKKAFIKMIFSLPTEKRGHPPGFTQDALKKAASSASVLFVLTEKDLTKEDDLVACLLLTMQLAQVENARQVGIKQFDRIAHPLIKLFWADALFREKASTPEILAYLRHALENGKARELEGVHGPSFEAFKENVIRTDELAKQPRIELVKKHVQKDRFPVYGGGFGYVTKNCLFAHGPVLVAIRPFENDSLKPERGKQGELFTSDIVKGTTSQRLVPIIKPNKDTLRDFDSPILSINTRGDLLCRWTIEGNGNHGMAILKKGANSFVVKRIDGLALESGSRIVSDSHGAWYLIVWSFRSDCEVHRIDDNLTLTSLGKFVSARFPGCDDARFIAKDVLHLFSGTRCIDFHIDERKWLHHREVHQQTTYWAPMATVLQSQDGILHHLWSQETHAGQPKLIAVNCQSETDSKPLKICDGQQFRAIMVGNRIVVCYTFEKEPKKLFFRIVHMGQTAPTSEITIDNELDRNLDAEYMQIHVEGERIWFVNTLEPDTVYELRIAEEKR